MDCPQCGHTSGRQERYCPACAKRLAPPQIPGAPLSRPAEPVFQLEPASSRPSSWRTAAPYVAFLSLWGSVVLGGGVLLVARAAGAHPVAGPWLAATAALLFGLLTLGWRTLESRRLASTRYAFRPYRLDRSSHVFRRTARAGVPLGSVTAVRVETSPEQRRHGLGTLLLELRDPAPGQDAFLPVEDIEEPDLWRRRILDLLALNHPEPDAERPAA